PRDNFSIENIETYTIVKNKRTFSDEESVALVFSTDTIEDISKVSTKINEPATGDWETVQVGEESFNVRKLTTGELRSQLSTDPCMYKRTIDAYYITDSTQDITITSYDKTYECEEPGNTSINQEEISLIKTLLKTVDFKETAPTLFEPVLETYQSKSGEFSFE